MAYVVDGNGNAKTTLNVVVPTLHDMIVAGKDGIMLMNGGVILVDKGTDLSAIQVIYPMG